MDSFDNIQVEDLAALEAYEASQELQWLDDWDDQAIEDANAELQCLAN